MNKSTVIAVVVFAGLLAAAVLSLQKKPERGITRVSFAQVGAESIDRLEVTGKQPISLEKKDGKWLLASGKTANAEAIKSALEAIPRIDTAEFVTKNPDRFVELEVDDEKGTRVKASAGGKTVAEFTIGKWGAEGAYLKVGEAVYAAKGLSQWTFAKSVSGWQNLQLFDDASGDLTRIEIALAGQPPFALELADGRWGLGDAKLVPAGFRFDDAQARSLAGMLAGLSAQEFLDGDPGAATTGLSAPDVVAFLGKAGARRELRLGATVEGAVFAQVEGSPEVVKLPEYVSKGLRKSPADFRDLSLMRFETAQVKRLEIVEGKNALVFEKGDAGWRLARASPSTPEGFALDPTAVDRRLGQLASARATRHVATPGNHGLVKPAAAVSVELADGSRASLSFGSIAKDEEQEVSYVRGNVDGGIYFMTRWLRGQLLGGMDTFRPAPRPQGFDPSQLNNLPPEVREALMRQMAQQPPPMP